MPPMVTNDRQPSGMENQWPVGCRRPTMNTDQRQRNNISAIICTAPFAISCKWDDLSRYYCPHYVIMNFHAYGMFLVYLKGDFIEHSKLSQISFIVHPESWLRWLLDLIISGATCKNSGQTEIVSVRFRPKILACFGFGVSVFSLFGVSA